jgi:hypothetical protein
MSPSTLAEPETPASIATVRDRQPSIRQDEPLLSMRRVVANLQLVLASRRAARAAARKG